MLSPFLTNYLSYCTCSAFLYSFLCLGFLLLLFPLHFSVSKSWLTLTIFFFCGSTSLSNEPSACPELCCFSSSRLHFKPCFISSLVQLLGSAVGRSLLLLEPQHKPCCHYYIKIYCAGILFSCSALVNICQTLPHFTLYFYLSSVFSVEWLLDLCYFFFLALSLFLLHSLLLCLNKTVFTLFSSLLLYWF